MDRACSIPPMLPSADTRQKRVPVLVLLALALLMSLAYCVIEFHIPAPVCLLRQSTGIPCPTCGGTRSLAAWVQLDLPAAFRFNPLIFLASVAALLWSIVRGVERLSGKTFLPTRLLIPDSPWAWLAGSVAVALNWIYLCLTLPR